MNWSRRLPWKTMGKWWVVGLVFSGLGLALLYLFRDVLRLPLLLATTLSAEISHLIRFVVTDRWVFEEGRPTWKRLWQFHVAGAGGMAIWWTAVNVLPRFGIHYLLAAVAGTACSVLLSMAASFLWVWRKRGVAAGMPAEGIQAVDLP